VAEADDLVAKVRALEERASRLLDRAEERDDLRASAAFVSRLTALVDLLGRLRGELVTSSTTVNVVAVVNAPAFQAVLRVLSHHPAVHAEVLAKLNELGRSLPEAP